MYVHMAFYSIISTPLQGQKLVFLVQLGLLKQCLYILTHDKYMLNE